MRSTYLVITYHLTEAFALLATAYAVSCACPVSLCVCPPCRSAYQPNHYWKRIKYENRGLSNLDQRSFSGSFLSTCTRGVSNQEHFLFKKLNNFLQKLNIFYGTGNRPILNYFQEVLRPQQRGYTSSSPPKNG